MMPRGPIPGAPTITLPYPAPEEPDNLRSTTGSRARYDQRCLFGRPFDSGDCLSSDALGLARKSWRAEHRDFISCSVETARYPRTTVSTLCLATLADRVPVVPLPHGEILHAIARSLVELTATVRLNIDALFLVHLSMAQSTGLAPAAQLGRLPDARSIIARSRKGSCGPLVNDMQRLSDITLDHVPSSGIFFSSIF